MYLRSSTFLSRRSRVRLLGSKSCPTSSKVDLLPSQLVIFADVHTEVGFNWPVILEDDTNHGSKQRTLFRTWECAHVVRLQQLVAILRLRSVLRRPGLTLAERLE